MNGCLDKIYSYAVKGFFLTFYFFSFTVYAVNIVVDPNEPVGAGRFTSGSVSVPISMPVDAWYSATTDTQYSGMCLSDNSGLQCTLNMNWRLTHLNGLWLISRNGWPSGLYLAVYGSLTYHSDKSISRTRAVYSLTQTFDPGGIYWSSATGDFSCTNHRTSYPAGYATAVLEDRDGGCPAGSHNDFPFTASNQPGGTLTGNLIFRPYITSTNLTSTTLDVSGLRLGLGGSQADYFDISSLLPNQLLVTGLTCKLLLDGSEVNQTVPLTNGSLVPASGDQNTPAITPAGEVVSHMSVQVGCGSTTNTNSLNNDIKVGIRAIPVAPTTPYIPVPRSVWNPSKDIAHYLVASLGSDPSCQSPMEDLTGGDFTVLDTIAFGNGLPMSSYSDYNLKLCNTGQIETRAGDKDITLQFLLVMQ